MKVSLSGKVAVVTGASSGIGLAMTQAFLEAEAAEVVAIFRRKEVPDELCNGQVNLGSKLWFVQGDVGEEAIAEEFTRTAVDHFGRLDVLVNDAAVTVVKALHEHTPQE